MSSFSTVNNSIDGLGVSYKYVIFLQGCTTNELELTEEDF